MRFIKANPVSLKVIEWYFEGTSLKCYEYKGNSDTDNGKVVECAGGCFKIQEFSTGLFTRYAFDTKAT